MNARYSACVLFLCLFIKCLIFINTMESMNSMNDVKFERTHKQAKERKKFEKQVFAANCVRLRNAWALNELKQKLLKEEKEKQKERERLESLERSVMEWNSYVFVKHNR